MKQGRSRFGLLVAVLSGACVLGGAGAMSPAYAQKATAGHAKPKNKKPKSPGKGAHHAGSGGASGASKAHSQHATKQGGAPQSPAQPAAPSAGSKAAAKDAKDGKDAKEAVELRLPVQRVTLDNGLRVVMSVDKASPAVAVAIAYDIGSRDETKGRSGSARLLERMMDEGSANVLAGDHQKLVAIHGGQAKSATGTETTVFTNSLPSNELALGLWLEADRMKSLTMRPETFELARREAQEQARAAIGSSPDSSGTRLNELIFQGSWAYEHSALGSPDDLAAVTLDELKTLHASHYGPNTAALVITGDFDPDAAMELVHKHFDAIPKVTAGSFSDGDVPEQTAQRTAVVRGEDAKSTEIRYGWAIPPSESADRAAVELAAIAVADGESSRLYQLLVRDKGLADDVSAFLTPMSRGPGSLRIAAKLADGAKVGDAEKLIEGELRRLGTQQVTDVELKRAQRRAQSRFMVDGLSTLVSRADRLAAYELVRGSALHINEELPKIAAVSAEDVRRAASQYLGPTRRTLVETYPMSVDKAAEEPAAPHAHAPAAIAPESHAEAKAPAPAAPAKHDGKKTASKSGAKGKKGASKSGSKAATDAKKKTSSNAKSKKPKKP